MISDQAQIQALINGIDEALNKTNPRLPWVMSNDAAQQRQVLEQTRQYLIALQQQTEADRLSRAAGGDALPKLSAALESPLPASASPSESAQQVLQAVLQEMNYWRVNMLQPLRTEIDSLQRQREILAQEIRQLEAQRQQHSLGAQPNQQLLMEFLQSAMAQMQANLSSQVTQMIAGQMQSSQPALSANASLTPAERLAHMQTAQMQSDQLMLKLDSTLQVIFESLNRNVQTYEESLEQGLNRMHSLGQQGEAMFAFLVNRLAQQLGREASTFLQASAGSWQQSSNALSADSTDPQASSDHETSPGSETAGAKTSDFLSQIPDPAQPTFVPAVPFDLTEEVLDISELELLDQPFDQPFDQPPADGALAGLDVELSQLDLGAIPSTPETPPFDLFAGNQPLPHSEPLKSESAPLPSPSPTVSDLESALDLLNQLSAEMQAQTMEVMEETVAPQPPAERSSETEFITIPDSLYDDAFYSNLYHDPTDDRASIGFDSPADPTPIDPMTLEQAWFDGLGDPAVEGQPEPLPQPDYSSRSVSQSLENFLLSNPAPTAADSDLFAEFTESTESVDQPSPDSAQSGSVDSESLVEATPSETIASLSDLIPADFSRLDAGNLAGDEATPSIPEPLESLPIAEAPSEPFQLDLGNDADVLAQLGADLAQFGGSAAPSEPTAMGWDLFSDLPNADLATPEPSEPDSDPPAVTIEGLEDLFADLPAENSAQVEATPDLFAQLKAAFAQDPAAPIEIEQPIVLKYLDSDSSDDSNQSDSEKKK